MECQRFKLFQGLFDTGIRQAEFLSGKFLDQHNQEKKFEIDEIKILAQQAQTEFENQIALAELGLATDREFRLGGGGDGSGKPTFTRTQKNKGAATAGIPLADFESLDQDVQNIFINQESEIDQMKKAIRTARENNEDPAELEREISTNSSLPPEVKNTLVKYLWSIFPRPELTQLPGAFTRFFGGIQESIENIYK